MMFAVVSLCRSQAFDMGFGIKVMMEKVVFASSCFGFEVFSQINPQTPSFQALVLTLSHPI